MLPRNVEASMLYRKVSIALRQLKYPEALSNLLEYRASVSRNGWYAGYHLVRPEVDRQNERDVWVA